MAYGNYRRGYGYGPEAQGFYDPFRKGPAWGQGISGLLRQFAIVQKFKREQEQQKWQRGITERELASLEKLRTAQTKKAEQPRAMPEWQYEDEMAKDLVRMDKWSTEDYLRWRLENKYPQKEEPTYYPEKAITDIQERFGITREQWDKMDTPLQGKYFKGYFDSVRQEQKPPFTPYQQRQIDRNHVWDLIKLLDGELEKLQGEKFMAGIDGRTRYDPKIANLKKGKSQLIKFLGKRRLTEKDRDLIRQYSDFELLKKGMFPLDSGEREITPETRGEVEKMATEIYSRQKRKGKPISMSQARKWAREYLLKK